MLAILDATLSVLRSPRGFSFRTAAAEVVEVAVDVVLLGAARVLRAVVAAGTVVEADLVAAERVARVGAAVGNGSGTAAGFTRDDERVAGVDGPLRGIVDVQEMRLVVYAYLCFGDVAIHPRHDIPNSNLH